MSDPVEKTSPPCGGERAETDVDGGEDGEAQETESLGSTCWEEEGVEKIVLEVVAGKRAIWVKVVEIEVSIVIQVLRCQGHRARRPQGKVARISLAVKYDVMAVVKDELMQQVAWWFRQ